MIVFKSNVRCVDISFVLSAINSIIFARHVNRCLKLLNVGSFGATQVNDLFVRIPIRSFLSFILERGNYWQARAQQDANFNAQLEDYERQRAANTQRNEELRQRYAELLADEDYKVKSCRLCPNCGRIVQHLEGCDLMVCGRNYHGGDQQSGCGQGFRWSQARPYAGIGNTGPEQVANDIPAPEQQKTVVHEGIQ